MEPEMDTSGNRTLSVGSFVVFGITFFVVRWCFRRSSLPPGPPALPVVGSLPWLIGDIRERLREMALRYGDVFTVYLGSTPVVVVAHHGTVRQALQKHGRSLLDRPENAVLQLSPHDLDMIRGAAGVEKSPDNQMWRGVLEASGPTWREQRTFIQNAFRQVGIATADYESRILEECTHMIGALLKQGETGPLDPQPIMMKAVSNLIHHILYGYRCEYDDPRYNELLDNTETCFTVLGSLTPTVTFPALKYLPGDWFGWKKFMNAICTQLKNFKTDIEEARRSRHPGTPCSLIDAYLNRMDQTRHDPSSTFDDNRLLATMGNLFGAGSETTTTTLLWGIIYLLHHPPVLQRLRDEVEKVIGSERPPTMKDKINMPYMEACILEIQRMADILPLNPPRLAAQDVTLAGKTIPQGSTVVLFWYSVHRDPTLWTDPYCFRPERFLDANGKVVGKDRVMPFSLGRRNCLGEPLAKMILFLFFTSIMQHLDFHPPGGRYLPELAACHLPELTGNLGLTYTPKPFKLTVKSRRL